MCVSFHDYPRLAHGLLSDIPAFIVPHALGRVLASPSLNTPLPPEDFGLPAKQALQLSEKRYLEIQFFPLSQTHFTFSNTLVLNRVRGRVKGILRTALL